MLPLKEEFITHIYQEEGHTQCHVGHVGEHWFGPGAEAAVRRMWPRAFIGVSAGRSGRGSTVYGVSLESNNIDNCSSLDYRKAPGCPVPGPG